MFEEWRRGLYELISNGIHGNIKKDNVIATLSEVTVSKIFIFIRHNFYSKTINNGNNMYNIFSEY